jgi:SAM-dependent methyltransferase
MMKTIWEGLAKEDPYFYILTVPGIDYSKDEGVKYFFKSGEEFVAEMRPLIDQYVAKKDKAVEIGCGVGRLTFPHAKIFNEIYAVDISETMLKLLNEEAQRRNVANIRTFLPDQNWDNADSYDFAYSYIVFQHIEEIEVIEDYIIKISRSLKNNGIAWLHFDTRPQILYFKVRKYIPEIFLPRTQRRGVRRVLRGPGKLAEMFNKHGLQIVREINKNTENHVFILKK